MKNNHNNATGNGANGSDGVRGGGGGGGVGGGGGGGGRGGEADDHSSMRECMNSVLNSRQLGEGVGSGVQSIIRMYEVSE